MRSMEVDGRNPLRRVRTFLSAWSDPLQHQLVANSVNRDQIFWFTPVVCEFFSQLHDYLVQSPRCAVVIVTPHLIQQTIARKHLGCMCEK